MKLLIIGGKLQGIEIAYLAKKAGFFVTLVDKNDNVPASGLADVFIRADAFDEVKIAGLFKDADIVFPAVENLQVLDRLLEYGRASNTRVIFDKKCYEISSSKTLSNKLFRELNLPCPENYPECGFPVIVKPDRSSGSANVYKASDIGGLNTVMPLCGDSPVVQEYIDGRGLSMEVIGGKTLPITEVLCGGDYDCIGINAPALVSKEAENEFCRIGRILAGALCIDGIFDIEAIERDGKIYLLEIDARFPSQTPISVYHAYGVNMVEMLAFPNVKTEIAANKICLYRQILVTNREVEIVGEHIISKRGRLSHIRGFFGADEAVTDYGLNSGDFAAILVITADTPEKANEKLNKCIQNIRNRYVKTDPERY